MFSKTKNIDSKVNDDEKDAGEVKGERRRKWWLRKMIQIGH